MIKIIGHKKQKEELASLIEKGRLSHAVILSGKEGMGKQLIALETAKDLLCLSGNKACGTCDSCKKFDAGSHPDFMKIEEDGKFIKVVQMKEATSFVTIKPILSKKKLVIIDNAEKMNIDAQNKLLKTFEEPPSYCTIILVTNNLNGLLDTVRSRGYNIAFEPLKKEEIEGYLVSEHKLDAARTKFVAQFSEGSLKKAKELVTNEEIQELVQLPELIFSEIIKEDEYKLIKYASDFDKKREYIPILLDYILTWIRDISIVKSSYDKGLVINQDKLDELRRQSNHFDSSKLIHFKNEIMIAKERVRNNVNPVITLTFCLLKLQEDYNEYSSWR